MMAIKRSPSPMRSIASSMMLTINLQCLSASIIEGYSHFR